MPVRFRVKWSFRQTASGFLLRLRAGGESVADRHCRVRVEQTRPRCRGLLDLSEFERVTSRTDLEGNRGVRILAAAHAVHQERRADKTGRKVPPALLDIADQRLEHAPPQVRRNNAQPQRQRVRELATVPIAVLVRIPEASVDGLTYPRRKVVVGFRIFRLAKRTRQK